MLLIIEFFDCFSVHTSTSLYAHFIYKVRFFENWKYYEDIIYIYIYIYVEYYIFFIIILVNNIF